MHPIARYNFQSSLTVREHENLEIELNAINFELSDTLQTYVHKKLGNVLKRLGSLVRRVEVRLRITRYPETQHHSKSSKKGMQEAEITVHLNGHPLIRGVGHTDDMYASILVASHRVARALRRRNQRIVYRNTHEQPSLEVILNKPLVRFAVKFSTTNSQFTVRWRPL